jgi:hypothetical protein
MIKELHSTIGFYYLLQYDTMLNVRRLVKVWHNILCSFTLCQVSSSIYVSISSDSVPSKVEHNASRLALA